MNDKTFVDTNVLIYAHDVDAKSKHEVAKKILGELWGERGGVLSTQVLQEFYVAVTRKLASPLEPGVAHEAVRELAALPVVRVDIPLILSAIPLSQQRQISFWDALIVRAALEGGASVLYSEDLQHGQGFETLSIQNPLQ